MMRDTGNRQRRLTWLAVAAAALLLASLPLGAQERTARSTRPQSRTSASAPSSTHSNPPSARGTAGRTRPGGSGGGGRTVVENRRPGGRTPGRSHGHYYPGGYYGGHHSLFWRPYWWWSIGYYGYPFYYGYPGVPYYYGRVAPNSDLGGLDLNVRPKKADVYLNGQRIGRVKAFDGYPGYLWLEGGTYDLVFYKPGYQTLYREVTVFAGSVIDVDERMVPGDATPPEQVLAEALEQRPDRRAEYEEEEGGEYRYSPERARPAPGAEEAEPPKAGGERAEGEARGMVDAREQPGRVVLAVTPSDASVYLDGRFLGTGEELSRLHSGLMVDPGEHRLSAVRPGHEAQELDFEVASGQQLSLAINLKPSGS